MAKNTNKRKVKVDAEGEVHIHSSFNNIIISITNKSGQVISWSSAGKQGFRGSKKNTPYAATQAADKVAQEAMSMGLSTIVVKIKGPGGGREAAVRGLQAAGLKVTRIIDITPVPHNGCRPPKKRRV